MCSAILALALLLLLPATATAAKVHAFFYLWYGTPAVDGQYVHWNHSVLHHWDAAVDRDTRELALDPAAGLIHSPYYPHGGPFSSRDAASLDEQVSWAREAGIDVLVLCWTGRPDNPTSGDSQGILTDSAVRGALEAVQRVGRGMQVSFLLEPYDGRSGATVVDDMHYLRTHYLDPFHDIVARDDVSRPLVYVYDSYTIAADAWRDVLLGSLADYAFLGLWHERRHGAELVRGGFAGAFTYFAAPIGYGSTMRNWPEMGEYARENGMLLSLSVGPGYDDTIIRPWNRANVVERRSGQRYLEMWRAACDAAPQFVSITSWNEFGEGTQISKVEPMRAGDRVYLDYDGGPDQYIQLSKQARQLCDIRDEL